MPSHDGPTPFVRLSLRFFGPLAAHRLRFHPALPAKLARARDPLVPAAFLASVYGRVVVGAAVGLVLFSTFLWAAGGVRGADARLVAAFGLAPVLCGLFAYSHAIVRPDLQIGSRRRDLEANLPYALNFMASMAAAGVLPSEIFGALGKQEVYGEVRHQARAIHRDTRLFSRDLVTALQDAAKRSPSRQFEDFLQGAVNTVTSGGDLRRYLLAKSEHYSSENRRKQKAFLESLGVMAESYVVVAAAAPLFLLVILSIMAILRAAGDPVLYLNLLVLGAMPMIHMAFTYILRNLRAD